VKCGFGFLDFLGEMAVTGARAGVLIHHPLQ